jgi:GNAT superfamily N-acetyltransferase
MPDLGPSTAELDTIGASVTLRDGTRIRVRQGHSGDRDLLVRGFQNLSEESRYRRFLAPMSELSDSMVDYLTQIDHRDHEALVALSEDTGEGIGVARYVRDPKRPEAAEVAVTVIDQWQGRGVGTLLLELIGCRARDEGIETFTAMALASNHEIMELLQGLGPVAVLERDTGVVQVETPVPHAGLSPVLKKLLTVAARRANAVGETAAGETIGQRHVQASPRRD